MVECQINLSQEYQSSPTQSHTCKSSVIPAQSEHNEQKSTETGARCLIKHKLVKFERLHAFVYTLLNKPN